MRERKSHKEEEKGGRKKSVQRIKRIEQAFHSLYENSTQNRKSFFLILRALRSFEKLLEKILIALNRKGREERINPSYLKRLKGIYNEASAVYYILGFSFLKKIYCSN